MNIGGFGLGGFAGKLNPGDLNGALKNSGSTYQVPEVAETQPAAAPIMDAMQPAAGQATEPPMQATDEEQAPFRKPTTAGFTEAPLKGIINLQTIGSLVGSYFGGPIGGKIGGQVGGMASRTATDQRQKGLLG